MDYLQVQLEFSSDYDHQNIFELAEGITYFSLHKFMSFDWIDTQNQSVPAAIRNWSESID
jgi:hypothetical protein